PTPARSSSAWRRQSSGMRKPGFRGRPPAWSKQLAPTLLVSLGKDLGRRFDLHLLVPGTQRLVDYVLIDTDAHVGRRFSQVLVQRFIAQHALERVLDLLGFRRI